VHDRHKHTNTPFVSALLLLCDRAPAPATSAEPGDSVDKTSVRGQAELTFLRALCILDFRTGGRAGCYKDGKGTARPRQCILGSITAEPGGLCTVPCRAAAPSCSPPPSCGALLPGVWCVVCGVGVSESSHSSSSLSRSRVVPRVGVFLLCNYQCGISSSILPVKSTVHVCTHCASSRLHARTRTRTRARVETNARCELHRASFLWTESHPQPFHGRGVLGSCADCGSARAQAIASYCDTRHAWEHA
jgi:hypothetical protein